MAISLQTKKSWRYRVLERKVKTYRFYQETFCFMKLNELEVGEKFEYSGDLYEKLSDANNCEIYCYNYTKNASTYLPKYLEVKKINKK